MVERKLLIGNWKLNHSFSSAQAFLDACPRLDLGSVEAAVAPVSLMLDFMGRGLRPLGLKLAAQNVFYESKGPFTGEHSAEQLAELGVSFSIVGHSERRKLFNETDEIVSKKTLACLKASITPVICVGETLFERDSSMTKDVISRQVSAVIDNLPNSVAEEIIFAYEPLWAIGSGKSASLADIEEIHRLIRQLLEDSFGLQVKKRILYGGSVSPENILEISTVPDVDGVLVGGASLQAESFLAMVRKLQGA